MLKILNRKMFFFVFYNNILFVLITKIMKSVCIYNIFFFKNFLYHHNLRSLSLHSNSRLGCAAWWKTSLQSGILRVFSRATLSPRTITLNVTQEWVNGKQFLCNHAIRNAHTLESLLDNCNLTSLTPLSSIHDSMRLV